MVTCKRTGVASFSSLYSQYLKWYMAPSKSLVNEWMNLNMQKKSFKRLRHTVASLVFAVWMDDGCLQKKSLENSLTLSFLKAGPREAEGLCYGVSTWAFLLHSAHQITYPISPRELVTFCVILAPIHFPPFPALFCGPGDWCQWTASCGLLLLLTLGWVLPIGSYGRRSRSRK